MVPYLHNDDEWIGYEDKESIVIKVIICIAQNKEKKLNIKKK